MDNNKKGKFKTGEQRTEQLNLRLSKSELAIIDKLCQNRKKCGASLTSRADVIMLSVKFALGEVNLVDRMEMNLLEGNNLWDSKNYPTGKYGGRFLSND